MSQTIKGAAKYKLISILSFSIYPEQELLYQIKRLILFWKRGNHLKVQKEVGILEQIVQFIDTILYKPEQEFMELALDETRNVQMFIALHLKLKLLKKAKSWLETTLSKIPFSPGLKGRLENIIGQIEEFIEKVGRLLSAMEIGYKIEKVVREIQKVYPEVVDFWIGEVNTNGKASVFLEIKGGPDEVVGSYDMVTFEGVEKIQQLEEKINRQFKQSFISHFYLA